MNPAFNGDYTWNGTAYQGTAGTIYVDSTGWHDGAGNIFFTNIIGSVVGSTGWIPDVANPTNTLKTTYSGIPFGFTYQSDLTNAFLNAGHTTNASLLTAGTVADARLTTNAQAVVGRGISVTRTYSTTNRIDFIGDSLTYGTGATAGVDTFPDTLAFKMQAVPINQGFAGKGAYLMRTNDDVHSELWTLPTVIWAGNNDTNADTVVTNVAAIVANRNSVGNSNYVVLGILNNTNNVKGTAQWSVVTNVNAQLASTYGAKFCDVRRFLIDSSDTNTDDGLWSYTNEVVSAAYRNPGDVIHLNPAGYNLVANAVLSSSFGKTNLLVTEGRLRQVAGDLIKAPIGFGSVAPSSIKVTSMTFTNPADGHSFLVYLYSDGALALPTGGTMYFTSGTIANSGNPLTAAFSRSFVLSDGTTRFTFQIAGDGQMQMISSGGKIYYSGAIGDSTHYMSDVWSTNFHGSAASLTALNGANITGGTITTGAVNTVFWQMLTNAAGIYSNNPASYQTAGQVTASINAVGNTAPVTMTNASNYIVASNLLSATNMPVATFAGPMVTTNPATGQFNASYNGGAFTNIINISSVSNIHYVNSSTFSNILSGYMLGTNNGVPVMWAVSTNIVTY